MADTEAKIAQLSIRTLSGGEISGRIAQLSVRTLSGNFPSYGRIAQLSIRTLSLNTVTPSSGYNFPALTVAP